MEDILDKIEAPVFTFEGPIEISQVRFNQDHSLLVVGSNKGFAVMSAEPL